MSANLDMTNGRANMAFIGDRKDIWHRMGEQMQPGQSVEDWAKAAGLSWTALKVLLWAGNNPADIQQAEAFRAIQRDDTLHTLGIATDRYQIVQPIDSLNLLQRYVEADPRFGIDTAGALGQGETIWATATFADGKTVAGDRHVARLLMTTTFDGSGATILKGTITRVVCWNTLAAALANKACEIRTRHNTKFDAVKACNELAVIAQGFDTFKNMGDAMGLVKLPDSDVSKLFKTLLEIPFDAPKSEVSTRKMNQFADLSRAYSATVQEGTEKGTAWTALNAVTRYVDHDRSTRNGDEGRFVSAQFGTGATMKAKAVEVLCEMGGLKLADFQKVMQSTKADAGADDITALLRNATRPN